LAARGHLPQERVEVLADYRVERGVLGVSRTIQGTRARHALAYRPGDHGAIVQRWTRSAFYLDEPGHAPVRQVARSAGAVVTSSRAAPPQTLLCPELERAPAARPDLRWV